MALSLARKIGIINSLGFDFPEFVIVGSFSIELMGGRPANDIDILISKNQYARCLRSGSWSPRYHSKPRRTILHKRVASVGLEAHFEVGNPEVFHTFEQMKCKATCLCGLPCIDLVTLLQFKLAFHRAKDVEDIDWLVAKLTE